MKAHAETAVSDGDFATRAERWPEDTPDTKEAYYIREIFDSQSFPHVLHTLMLKPPHRPLPLKSSCKDCCALDSARRLGLFGRPKRTKC